MKYSPALIPAFFIGNMALIAGSELTAAASTTGVVKITNTVFTNRSADCADHAHQYTASVTDIKRQLPFESTVSLGNDATSCFMQADSIPNYDFNDDSARFVEPVAEADISVSWPRVPVAAAATTSLSQRSYDAILLNGVVLDLLSAGCYNPSAPRANADGNTAIGCKSGDRWLLDPLGPGSNFGTDSHNAHTQPDGTYHYHGNPNALFDDNPGAQGSPLIGYAADGFPVYGSWIIDQSTGQLRKAQSGYSLISGKRPVSQTDPGGTYDGTYIDDYEFTGSGDLDQCNGMTVDGQYAYYVTDSYPWVLACFTGRPDESFGKRSIRAKSRNK